MKVKITEESQMVPEAHLLKATKQFPYSRFRALEKRMPSCGKVVKMYIAVVITDATVPIELVILQMRVIMRHQPRLISARKALQPPKQSESCSN